MIQPKPTYYNETDFRSRIEARWAVFFDSLEVGWFYEPEHFTFGLVRPWLSDQYEFKEHLNNALYENEWDDDEDVIREVYRERYERHMYLPDFWLPDFEHWVEIKGKPPTFEEQNKARNLARQTKMPVTILWGNIPDPKEEDWGKCTEVYGGDMNIIALLVIEHSIKAMQRAFTAARQIRFE